MDEELVAELDRRVGRRRRSAFIARTIERVLDDERRWDAVAEALDTIADEGHEWDEDAAAWVRQQRQADPRRVG